MALRDLIHDRKVALCIIFSLIAVIAPLLLLFGLKNGIVSQLRHQLLDDPRTREVRITGNGNYDFSWLERLAERPEVGFSIPLTRSLNTQADLVRDGQRFVAGAEVIPTRSGDPLLSGVTVPRQDHQVVLSASAARRLELKPGESFRLMVNRKVEGQNQRTAFALTVSGVLDDARFAPVFGPGSRAEVALTGTPDLLAQAPLSLCRCWWRWKTIGTATRYRYYKLARANRPGSAHASPVHGCMPARWMMSRRWLAGWKSSTSKRSPRRHRLRPCRR